MPAELDPVGRGAEAHLLCSASGGLSAGVNRSILVRKATAEERMARAHGELRLMYVLAHPDDETLGGGGPLARYAAEGVGTYLVTATRGERGWWGPLAENPGLQAVGALREAELRCAAEALGLREVSLLDLIDGEVDQADPGPVIAAIARHIRRVRPQVVVTFGPEGVYGHPDHIAISQLATAAAVAAADAEFDVVSDAIPSMASEASEESGAGRPHEDSRARQVAARVSLRHPPARPAADGGEAPHRIAKLYYMVETAELLTAYEALVGEISMTVDGRARRAFGWADWMVTTTVDASGHTAAVWRAMECHSSQHAGLGGLLAPPETERRRLMGRRTYYRALSLVNGGRGIETDLFDGLR